MRKVWPQVALMVLLGLSIQNQSKLLKNAVLMVRLTLQYFQKILKEKNQFFQFRYFFIQNQIQYYLQEEVKLMDQLKQPHTVDKIIHLKKSKQIMIITQDQNIRIYSYINDLYENIQNISGYHDEILDIKFARNNKNIIIMATNSNTVKIYDQEKKKLSFISDHTDMVMCVEMIKDILITGSKDKTINLYTYQNDQFTLRTTYTGHQEQINQISLSPHSQTHFTSVSTDKSLKLWKVHRKEFQVIVNAERTIHAHEKDINAVRYSPNEKLIGTASQDKSIKLWTSQNLNNNMVLKGILFTLGHKRGVWDINFSQHEKILVSSGGDLVLKIWNLVDGICIHTLQGHTGSVLKAQFVCQGTEVLSSNYSKIAGADGLIKLWNYKKNICINTFDKHEGKIWAFDALDDIFMTGDNDSNFIIWKDCTEEVQTEKKEKDQQNIINISKYNSHFRENQYVDAAKIAFQNNMIKGIIIALEKILKDSEFNCPFIFTWEPQDFQGKYYISDQQTDETLVEQQFGQIVCNFITRIYGVDRFQQDAYNDERSQQYFQAFLDRLKIIKHSDEIQGFEMDHLKLKELQKQWFIAQEGRKNQNLG